MFYKVKYPAVSCCVLVTCCASAQLVELSNEEMSDAYGQSLLNIDKYEYATGAQTNNFYRIKMNSIVETSVNIEHLQLTDGAGNPQIDIEHFSLNGGDTSNGNATVSSAEITNPFIEFAFDGAFSADTADNREFIGIRFGADNVDGYLSFGDQSDESGINWFRGYMTTTDVYGTVRTLDSQGGYETNINNISTGRQNNFAVNGLMCVDGATSFGFGTNGSCGNFDDVNGTFDVPDPVMRFPSVTLDFSSSSGTPLKVGGIVVNTSDGNPISQIVFSSDDLPLPDIDFEMEGQSTATVFGFDIDLEMLATGYLANLEARATMTQALSYIHRAQVSGSGFYLSAQNRDIEWRDAPSGDVAKQGWWMSIADPITLGDLVIDGLTLPDGSLVAIADAATAYLNIEANRVAVPFSEAAGGIFGSTVDVPLGELDLTGSAIIPVNVGSQSLGPNQTHITNCWNGSLGC